MTNIPDHIRKKIEEEAEKCRQAISEGLNINPIVQNAIDSAVKGFTIGSEYGYSLAMQEVGDKDKEIEILKSLITESRQQLFESIMNNMTVQEGAVLFNSYRINEEWQQFKTKHNI